MRLQIIWFLTFINVLIAISFLFFSTNVHAIDKKVIIGGSISVSTDYQEWTKDIPCHEIKTFNHPSATRATVELILICQALYSQGMDFVLKVYPNYGRALLEVKTGNCHIAAETAWEHELDDTSFYISDAIINKGEFEKGIYAIPENQAIFTVRNLEQLRHFKALIPTTWDLDIIALRSAGVPLGITPSKKALFRMLHSKRADFTLLEFSSEKEMQHTMNGITLKPILNIKIIFDKRRHFVVSKKAPNSKAIYKTLNAGLRWLRNQGIITKAFTESGFFHPEVKDWKIII